MPTEEKINGSMVLLLQKFVEANYNNEVWLDLIKNTEIKDSKISQEENYPVVAMESIIEEVSKKSGITNYDLKEKFGEFLVPNLLKAYRAYVNPSWKTFEMLEYTEKIMHHAVRKENSNANPPVLHISKVSDKLLIIDYHSRRKMSSIAIGIIKGIAAYYNESEKFNITPISKPDEERVQIKVEIVNG